MLQAINSWKFWFVIATKLQQIHEKLDFKEICLETKGILKISIFKMTSWPDHMPEVLHQQSILHQHQDLHLAQQGKGEWTALQPSDQQGLQHLCDIEFYVWNPILWSVNDNR